MTLLLSSCPTPIYFLWNKNVLYSLQMKKTTSKKNKISYFLCEYCDFRFFTITMDGWMDGWFLFSWYGPLQQNRILEP